MEQIKFNKLKKLNKDIDYIMDWYKITEKEAIRA